MKGEKARRARRPEGKTAKEGKTAMEGKDEDRPARPPRVEPRPMPEGWEPPGIAVNGAGGGAGLSTADIRDVKGVTPGELEKFARTGGIHIVGCGKVGGEYVTSIHKSHLSGMKGVTAYTFHMDPALEEEYREVVRLRKAREVPAAKVTGPAGKTEVALDGEGMTVRRTGGLIGRIGKALRLSRGETPAAGSPPAAMEIPPVGQTDFEQMVSAIAGTLEGVDQVILVCGMDEPAGFESARVFAEVAKEKEILSFCYVFLPGGFQNVEKVQQANRDLQRLRLIVDIVAVLPNSVYIAPALLASIMKETVELTTTAGLVNVDVADLRSTVQGGNVALIGIGEATGDDRLKEAVRGSLSHRLMLIDYKAVNKAVINVTGGGDMTVDEAEGASRWLARLISDDAKIVWGAEVDESMKGKLRVFVMAAVTPMEVLLYVYSIE